MWCYRKLFKMSLVGKMTIEEVLNLAKDKRSFYVKQIIDDVGSSGYCEMNRLAQDRNGW